MADRHNPELDQPGQTGNQEQATGRDGPAGHASTVIDDRHDHSQHGAHRRDHLADPVDQVQEGAFALGRRPPLYRLVSRGCPAKVLCIGDQGKQIGRG